MPRPRVFVSSFFYDLQQVRQDIGHFVDSHGFEAVLFEEGHIALGSSDAPVSYCYEEIEGCDILVSIIGDRFGPPPPSFDILSPKLNSDEPTNSTNKSTSLPTKMSTPNTKRTKQIAAIQTSFY